MSNPASKAFSALIRNLKVALGRAKTAKKTAEKAEKAAVKRPTLAAQRRKSEAAKKTKNAKLAAYGNAMNEHARQAEELAARVQAVGTEVARRTALLKRQSMREGGKGPDRHQLNERGR